MPTPAMPTKLVEMAGQLRTKREQLRKYFEKKGPDGTIDVDDTGRGEIKALNAELDDLQPKFERGREDWLLETANKKHLDDLTNPHLPANFFGIAAAGTDGAGTSERGEVKDLGDLFADSPSFKSFIENKKRNPGTKPNFEAELPINLKTLFQRSAGWQPFVNRQQGFIASPQQQPRLADSLPTATTTEAGIKWMVENLYTNNAAPIAEAGPYPESAFGLTEQFLPVQKIGHIIPVTDEQLADVPGVRDYLNNRMELGLKQNLDVQIARGTGVSPNLQGFFGLAGLLNQAQGTDVVADACYKAMVGIQTTAFADPTAFWFNPIDWMSVRLMKTAQGQYLFGNPDQVGLTHLWGLPVTTSTFITQGAALTGDFAQFACLWMRAGVGVEVTNSHNGNFALGIVAIRSQLRACLTVMRASAFSTVTFNAGDKANAS